MSIPTWLGFLVHASGPKCKIDAIFKANSGQCASFYYILDV